MKRSLAALTVVGIGTAALLGACDAPPTTPLPQFTPTETTAPLESEPSSPTTATSPLAVAVVGYTVPPRVTHIQEQKPACVARLGGQLPDPACTPGSVGSINPVEVCNAGFADRHRPSGTAAAKRRAMTAYHVVAADVERTEYDHLVPLSLGGSNDVTNLWPQVSDLPNKGPRNSKDAMELRLWRWVCTAPEGERADRLTRAQGAFARDWTAAEKFLGTAPA